MLLVLLRACRWASLGTCCRVSMTTVVMAEGRAEAVYSSSELPATRCLGSTSQRTIARWNFRQFRTKSSWQPIRGRAMGEGRRVGDHRWGGQRGEKERSEAAGGLLSPSLSLFHHQVTPLLLHLSAVSLLKLTQKCLQAHTPSRPSSYSSTSPSHYLPPTRHGYHEPRQPPGVPLVLPVPGKDELDEAPQHELHRLGQRGQQAQEEGRDLVSGVETGDRRYPLFP